MDSREEAVDYQEKHEERKLEITINEDHMDSREEAEIATLRETYNINSWNLKSINKQW